eukprot:TRINITY_DN16649_c0_g1_i1.p2 TRINITY_DN16649_c0_g1~~TRINITY_DN16649_c0_g1_i1.p2  ORF type:complete len:120 (-),score=8.62 TRINITY_DN16649_c0_g1_i1:78-437(-)
MLFVDPGMEAVGGVGHAFPCQRLEIMVDSDQVVGRNLVEPQPQSLGQEGVAVLGTTGDLARQAGVMALVEQNATGERELLMVGQFHILNQALHIAFGALHQCLLACGGGLHTRSPWCQL